MVIATTKVTFVITLSPYFEMCGGDTAKVRQAATTFILITRTFIMGRFAHAKQ